MSGCHMYTVTCTRSPVRGHLCAVTCTQSPVHSHMYTVTCAQSHVHSHTLTCHNHKFCRDTSTPDDCLLVATILELSETVFFCSSPPAHTHTHTHTHIHTLHTISINVVDMIMIYIITPVSVHTCCRYNLKLSKNHNMQFS